MVSCSFIEVKRGTATLDGEEFSCPKSNEQRHNTTALFAKDLQSSLKSENKGVVAH